MPRNRSAISKTVNDTLSRGNSMQPFFQTVNCGLINQNKERMMKRNPYAFMMMIAGGLLLYGGGISYGAGSECPPGHTCYQVNHPPARLSIAVSATAHRSKKPRCWIEV